MKGTLIISDYTDKMKRVAHSLKVPDGNIIPYETHVNEKSYHDWITKAFKNAEVEKIIIPLSVPTDTSIINSDGLILALHLRLNYELPLKKRLIPIVFLSNFTIETIIKNNNFDEDNNSQHLIFSKGIYFSSFDNEDIKKVLTIALPCPDDQYFSNVLSKINIHRKATSGGHDIANAWGCFKLAQVVGLRDKIFQLESISKHLKQLYAKSLICNNESFSEEKRIDLSPLKCYGRKILLIDDKADEGWAFLMKEIFKGAGDNFIYVDSSKYKADDYHRIFKDYIGFYKECKSHIGKDWDLIIIDLRLHPEREDVDNERIAPSDFSGYKLIDEFLSYNEGYQIMVSTASNKIWNINVALNRGASSYYTKESPDFNYSLNETKNHYDNFKNDVKKCFQRSYLREIYTELKKTKNQDSNQDAGFIAESNTALNMAWEQIKNNHLDFGFLTLFQSIEGIANKIYQVEKYQDSIGGITTIDKTDNNLYEWKLSYIEDNQNGSYFISKTENKEKAMKPQTLFKVSCMFNIKYSKDDPFLKRVGALNKVRNRIAHEGAKGFVTKENLIEILRVLEEIRIN